MRSSRGDGCRPFAGLDGSAATDPLLGNRRVRRDRGGVDVFQSDGWVSSSEEVQLFVVEPADPSKVAIWFGAADSKVVKEARAGNPLAPPAVSGRRCERGRWHTLTHGPRPGCGATRACMGAGAGGFDELGELARTLALGVVTHLLPDADLGLRERCHDTVAVRKRDEPVAVAPQRQYRPAVVEAGGGETRGARAPKP